MRDHIPINSNLTNRPINENHIELVLNSNQQELVDCNSFAFEIKIWIIEPAGEDHDDAV